MRLRPYHLLTLAAFVPASSWGQEKPAPEGHSIEVRFADDSVVKMVLKDGGIDVATRYGRLTVPTADVRRIEFGLRVPDETAKRIDAALIRLGGREAAARDSAIAELLALRESAYPALRRAAEGKDADLAKRAAEVVKMLSETVPAERRQLPAHDTVVAAEFTILGRVEASALQAKSPYFGETTLKLAELRSVRRLADERTTTLSVDAARHGGAQESWLDTGIEVRAGLILRVMASGTIEVRSPDGSVTQVGPDGRNRRTDRGDRGGMAPGGGPGGPGGFPARGGRAAPGGGVVSSSAGALIARIGDGRLFAVGSRYEGEAPASGRLFLRIYPDADGSECVGTYSVRVGAGR